MSQVTSAERKVGLDAVGLGQVARAHWNPSVAVLFEEAIKRGEGVLSADGPIICSTGKFTGRSPNDKFIVAEGSSEKNVAWGKVNRPIDDANFNAVLARMQAYTAGKEVFRIAGRALIRPTACRSASSPSGRGRACSRATCSFRKTTRRSASITSRSSP